MFGLAGYITSDDTINWQYIDFGDEDAFTITFPFNSTTAKPQERKISDTIKKALIQENNEWLRFNGKKWLINLDKMKLAMDIEGLEWLKGKIITEPEIEFGEERTFGKISYQANLIFYIDQELMNSFDADEISDKMDLILNMQSRELVFKGIKIELTDGEANFMYRLIRNAGKITLNTESVGLENTYYKSVHVNNSASRYKYLIGTKLETTVTNNSIKKEFDLLFTVVRDKGFIFKLKQEQFMVIE